jgi:hypothetical protein
LFVLFPTALGAQPNQSFLVNAEDLSHPLTFTELHRSGAHQLKLTRRFANDKEERILRIAEAAYPLAQAVKEGAVSKNEPGNRARQWWCSSFDGVRIPYAITRSAVVYYLDVSEGFRQNKPRGLWPEMKSSFLGYSAKLTWEKRYKIAATEFKNAYLVSLDLAWMQYCSPLCAMMFTATRNVVVKTDGSVLAIENDSCAPFGVS